MIDRILLLSWTVPPEITGSSVVVENLAKQFTRAEMIVAGERPQRRTPIEWKEDWPEIAYLTQGLAQTARGARWRRKLQIPLLLFRCWRLVKANRCAAIVAVFPSEEYLLVGYLVARLSGARLYPYFHNTYVEQCAPHSMARRFARWFQERVFTQAAHIFVMSDGMVELFRQRYPEVKCSALVHSFNEDIPEPTETPACRTPLRFVLSGNINASCADAVARLCEAVSRIDGTLAIFSGTARAHLKEMGMLRGNVMHEVVAREAMLRSIAEADIVLLGHGFKGELPKEEYETIFPTRTIEYLISGRPILAHAPADSFLARFLRERQCALVIDEPQVDALVNAIRLLCQDAKLRSLLVRNALRAAERFRAPIVAESLRAVLQAN